MPQVQNSAHARRELPCVLTEPVLKEHFKGNKVPFKNLNQFPNLLLIKNGGTIHIYARLLRENLVSKDLVELVQYFLINIKAIKKKMIGFKL